MDLPRTFSMRAARAGRINTADPCALSQTAALAE